jgi:hypothetical protein
MRPKGVLAASSDLKLIVVTGTGDIAVRDKDDYFAIVDRKKDMIIEEFRI